MLYNQDAFPMYVPYNFGREPNESGCTIFGQNFKEKKRKKTLILMAFFAKNVRNIPEKAIKLSDIFCVLTIKTPEHFVVNVGPPAFVGVQRTSLRTLREKKTDNTKFIHPNANVDLE